MKISMITLAPDEELADGLASFERQFRYPLGEEKQFSISHGRDYPRFFRAIGEPACFVAQDRGEVVGVVGCALAHLRTPTNQTIPAAYFGDIKISPKARATRTLYQLFKTTQAWLAGRAKVGFGVVMDNTAVLPERYTGKIGFPLFDVAGTITLFHIDTEFKSKDPQRKTASGHKIVIGSTATLDVEMPPAFELLGSDPKIRSRMEPVPLSEVGGGASGLLEDTRASKRLVDEDGKEIVSGHLSFLKYKNPEVAGALIEAACERCREMGYPKLFVSVSNECVEDLKSALAGLKYQTATATVYATGLDSVGPWRVNSAEI